MAIQDTMEFRRTGASSGGGSGFFPNESLGGFEAAQTPYVQGSLTANMTQLGTFVDSTQVDADPAGPIDNRTPLANDGAYQSAADLIHWYRFSYDPVLLGRDFGVGTPRHLTTIRGALAASDIDADVQPGQFDQQRDSLHFNSAGAADNDALVNDANEDFGIANAFTFMAWARTTTTAAGTSTLFHLRLSANATTLAANSIRVQRSGSSLLVQIMDANGVDSKEYTYLVFFTANTWRNIALTWNGTTLQVYSNGVPISPSSSASDDAVTLTNTARRLIVGGGNNGTTDPGQEWFGQIHSLLVWDVPLSSSAIAVVDAMGDGVGFTLDHTDEWLVFVTGANALEARRITFHDNTTGEIRLEQPLPNLGSAGDVYRVSRARDLWDDGPTAPECAEGLVDHRLLAFVNSTGGTCTAIRFWLKPIDPRLMSYEIAVSNRAIAATALPTHSPDTVAPTIKTTGVAEFATVVQGWRAPRDYATADETPMGSSGADVNVANNGELGVWIRRTTQPLARKGRTAWLLVAEAASHSVGGVGPWLSSMILLSRPAGFTPAFTSRFDRTPRVFGGARIVNELVDADFGFPVEGVPITVEQTAGPGAIEAPVVQPIDTDADGTTIATYIAPEDEGDVGDTVTVEARFFDTAS